MKTRYLKVFAAALIFILIFGLTALINMSPRNWKLQDFNSQKLKWISCNDGFQCASFLVPIDYEKLQSGTFKLQVMRHKALNKSPIGSLVVNPGGPGGSGINFAYNYQTVFSQGIVQNFDIVGFDGRGIGLSEPIRCLNDKQEDAFINLDGSAKTPEEVSALVKAAQDFANACSRVAGRKLAHISTLETAKDMEILRNLLGDQKLNYLGKSYGTYLGALYISLFPDKVGRFLLDGAIDPNVSFSDQNLAQVTSFEISLDQYLKKYKEFDKRSIQQFINTSAINPIKSKSGRELNRALLITALAASLYESNEGWDKLSKALHEGIINKSPDLLFQIADDYNGRDSSGHYYNNENDIGIAINCLDWKIGGSVSEMTAELPKFTEASPTFGPYISYSGLPCLYWKEKVVQPKLPFKDISSPPFLIIGVTKDPATPYIWSVNLAKEFKNSILLTLDGEGHTGQNRGSSCIDNKVDAYFLHGTLPLNGLSCSLDGN